MLPTLSRLSVRIGPVPRFRIWRSSRYLRISPLHLEFQAPLPTSSPAVRPAIPRLSRGISQDAYRAPTRSLSPMNPNNACLLCLTEAAGTELAEASFGSTQRDRLLTGFACWTLTAVYTPRGFLLHAALLGQAFAHCPIFVTAATRRCPGSVSVPMRRVTLSRPLPVDALVSRYLTNKLIGHRPIPDRQARRSPPLIAKPGDSTISSGISSTFAKGLLPLLSRSPRYVTYALLSRPPLTTDASISG